jgi:hypothetical protein
MRYRPTIFSARIADDTGHEIEIKRLPGGNWRTRFTDFASGAGSTTVMTWTNNGALLAEEKATPPRTLARRVGTRPQPRWSTTSTSNGTSRTSWRTTGRA